MMTLQIVSRDTMVRATLFDTSDMLIDPDGKGSNGSSHILFIAWTCYKMHYIVSGTCCKLFHMVDSRSCSRCETLFFYLSKRYEYTCYTYDKGRVP